MTASTRTTAVGVVGHLLAPALGVRAFSAQASFDLSPCYAPAEANVGRTARERKKEARLLLEMIDMANPGCENRLQQQVANSVYALKYPYRTDAVSINVQLLHEPLLPQIPQHNEEASSSVRTQSVCPRGCAAIALAPVEQRGAVRCGTQGRA